MIPVVPGWTSTWSMANLLTTILPLVVVAVGQMIVLISAGIDLSMTAVIAFASVVGASIMSNAGFLPNSSFAVPIAIFAMLAVGALIGGVNGVSVAWLRMPPFLVTLATGMFFSGAAILYTSKVSETTSIAGLPDSFRLLTREPVPFMPNHLWLTLLVLVAVGILLQRTVFGASLFAVGMNRTTARVSGIQVERTILLAYVISGMLAAVGAMMLTAQQETGDPKLAATKLLDIIGATVIGGTSLFGGKGRIVLTVFGVLFLVLIDTSLTMQGLSDEVVMVCKGTVILVAAILDSLRSRLAAS
jgi:ribose transport system permease protein